jgi:hypothetical protein
MHPEPDIEEFQEAVRVSLDAGTFIRLVAGKYRGTDSELQRVIIRRIERQGGDELSLQISYRTRDETRNVPAKSGGAEVLNLLEQGFRSAHLFAETGDAQLVLNKRGKPRLTRSKATQTSADDLAHDRSKRRFVDSNRRYLFELGVTDASGRVLPSMSGKWKQINKFVELFDSGLKEAGIDDTRPVEVVDFGAGKGYLTFAMHDHLRHVLDRPAHVLGVELRPALVEKVNAAAGRCDAEGIEFRAGDIAELPTSGVDVMVALHACDTATDQALFAGIRCGAALIMCAPCCHKQIRPQIVIPGVLQSRLRFGVHLNAEADMVTDTLRALLLEAMGYSVKVFEFVAQEHTTKNKMIVGTRSVAKDESRMAQAWKEIEDLKKFYGIVDHELERLLKSSEFGSGQT